MQIDKNAVVSFDYKLTNPQGQVLDSSEGRAPLTYLHGNQNIIPGLESAMQGKSAGDTFTATIAPENAYGMRDDRLVADVPRDRFPQSPEIQLGMQFHAQSPEGHQRVVTVVGVTPDQVRIDANHPLAGVTLTFDVTVREVRQATEDEIAHGHVHGPHGHQH